MAMDWQKIKDKIEAFCKKKYDETGIPPVIEKKTLVRHLNLNEEEAGRIGHVIKSLLKEEKLVKYGSKTYRWNITPHE